jgi:hypothetical protein
MPIRYEYDTDADVVHVDAVGDVTGVEIRGYFEAVVREPWWRPGLVRSAAYSGHARIAVLVANSLQYGIVRQFDGLSFGGGALMAPFYHEGEAIAWLAEPDPG